MALVVPTPDEWEFQHLLERAERLLSNDPRYIFKILDRCSYEGVHYFKEALEIIEGFLSFAQSADEHINSLRTRAPAKVGKETHGNRDF